MPIKVQGDLPAKGILENENIFVMDENRAVHQDIRPLQVCILNLMPVKQDTELQLLRALSNTPLQVDVTFLMVTSHVSLNTSANHLNRFYTTFEQIAGQRFDGLIITGAPVEDIAFEEVDYWQEVCAIMDWAEKHVTSTLHICWDPDSKHEPGGGLGGSFGDGGAADAPKSAEENPLRPVGGGAVPAGLSGILYQHLQPDAPAPNHPPGYPLRPAAGD